MKWDFVLLQRQACGTLQKYSLQKASALQSQALKSYEMKISEHIVKRTWSWMVKSCTTHTHLLPYLGTLKHLLLGGHLLHSPATLEALCCIFSSTCEFPNSQGKWSWVLLTTLTQSTAPGCDAVQDRLSGTLTRPWSFSRITKNTHFQLPFITTKQQRKKRISSHYRPMQVP